MITAAIIGFCVLLLVAAFLAPRLSRYLQRGGEAPLSGAESATRRGAPGKLGKWLSKPFSSSRKAVSKSGSTGRRGRSKAPF
jgi:hypothetical protein